MGKLSEMWRYIAQSKNDQFEENLCAKFDQLLNDFFVLEVSGPDQCYIFCMLYVNEWSTKFDLSSLLNRLKLSFHAVTF